MTNIAFPALVICPKDSLYLWENLEGKLEGSFAAYKKGYWNKIMLFDAAGNQWKVVSVLPHRHLGMIESIFAAIWNPRVKVQLEFDSAKPYPLENLKKEICSLVDFDDDILTQFIEADELKTMIKDASDFNDLVSLLKKHKVIV